MFRRVLLISVASISLAGCDSISSLFSGQKGCLDPAGQTTAIDAMKEAVEKYILKSAEGMQNGSQPTGSKIRATLDQIKFVFEDVRTTKEDPDSSKKFCTAHLKVSFPEQVLKDADAVFSILSEETVSKRADKDGIRKDANAIRFDADFNVQPTDDGAKIYAEVESPDPISHFIGDVVAGHLLRKPIEQANRSRIDQEAADQQQAQQAQTDQREALYEEAKATNDLAMQGINASWSALSSEVRQRVLPMQRAWLKRRDAECKIEAANASIEPTEREAARLECQARFNNQRASEINDLVNRTSYQQPEETY
ncbi:lysozyme inhibitor LprI family protein [Novosphingobium sp. 18052]|uniref:lysozyme inhibitor LprI family protein n=2 Tax=unclassified Novosphingobium TaxID=2644732 RepID=UPI00135B6B7F|nr:lysozyme inhibitor LprI family protein [Novosphingobium sp. 18052]